MDSLTEMLIKEKKRLAKLHRLVCNDIEHGPEGHLRIGSTSKKEQYYQVSDIHPDNGKYINKQELSLAQQLAQKEYAILFSKLLNRRLKLITQLLKTPFDDSQDPYYTLSAKRRKLVTPYLPSMDERIRIWLESHECESIVQDTDPEIDTNNGERVRSKSEKIIADKLFELGIPYRYEYPLHVDNAIIHPDFTIYDVKNDAEVYLEHLGMLDSPEYLTNALRRIDLYASEGITLGHGLLLSFESGSKPLNTRYLSALLAPFILPKHR